MKKRLLLLLLLGITSMCFAAKPTRLFRVDVSGNKTIVLIPVNDTGLMTTSNPGWISEESRNRMLYTSTEVTDKWQDVKFSFKPEASGDITIAFKGQWVQDSANSHWIDITDIRVNGKLIPNGDLKNTKTNSAGEVLPEGFYIAKGATYSKEEGEDSVAFMTICFSSSFQYSLNVVANEVYTVEAKVKHSALK